ncbi:hypothetical protein [Hydrogenimonas thermophila]|uniref:Uncharacterized protein n=1 Tax=Hydrogenimonas thermophila TaxID=223786 RepID=A0A1I5UNK5_9BACT|nr:hypothetical protein [Hydrogenimonas thermophila]WOE71011.1 hypothetical protein RZR91_05420 [Hydrogenimonas thermophila]WOE73529.1 hypothetical protein RZR97_05400 [Hydrogenimonas thermophila]SFP96657.1 hypothetical protein SAMN05216234_1663 [Hydrogenimonas thermophila]
MPIHVDPSKFQRPEWHDFPSKVPKLADKDYSQRELDRIKKEPTEVNIDGDVYTASRVSFKRMSRDELRYEEIDINSLNLTTETTGKDPVDRRVIVAFRDPNDPEKVIAFKLDRDVVKDLKKAFSSKDFFQRDDGILRLNGDAEEYLAGWYQDIKYSRGYEKADLNKNGRIDENEKGDLKIGFDRTTYYDYLGDKIVSANLKADGLKYQKYSETLDLPNEERGGLNSIASKALKYEKTIEKELNHTLKLDKDKDGVVTLKEGLVDFTAKNQSVEERVVEDIKIRHEDMIRRDLIKIDNFHVLRSKDISFQKSFEEQRAYDKYMKEYFEYMKNSFDFDELEKAIKEAGFDRETKDDEEESIDSLDVIT